MIRSLVVAGLVFCSTFVSTTDAVAQATKRGCVRDANKTGNQCAFECRQDQADALLICSAFGNATKQDCLRACSSDKDTCLEPYQVETRTCRDVCFTGFDAALSVCQSACGTACAGNSAFQVCRDAAKVQKYSCNLACTRTALEDIAAKQTCRKTFRECVKSCRS